MYSSQFIHVSLLGDLILWTEFEGKLGQAGIIAIINLWENKFMDDKTVWKETGNSFVLQVLFQL